LRVYKYIRKVFLEHLEEVFLYIGMGERASVKNIVNVPVAFLGEVGDGYF